jgi:two-component system, NarL family, nitrate/nitrite response regulator NarL
MTGAPDLRVLVVAGDRLLRAGLASLLSEQSGVIVVGQVDPDTALASSQLFQPDVWLWDLGWAPAPALEQMAGETERPAPRLLALAANESQAQDAWASGVRSLVLRDVDTPRLLAALEAAAQGLVVLDPVFAAAIRPTVDKPLPPLAEPLSARELQVLRLLADGLPNKAIAQSLGISEHTVKFHVTAIMSKLGVDSRTEAVVHATRLGLILL